MRLKPCPFCGHAAETNRSFRSLCQCSNRKSMKKTDWNRRPSEVDIKTAYRQFTASLKEERAKRVKLERSLKSITKLVVAIYGKYFNTNPAPKSIIGKVKTEVNKALELIGE